MARLTHTSASPSLKALKPDLWWIQKLLESLELFQSEHKMRGQLHSVSAAHGDLSSYLLGLHVVGQNRASCFVFQMVLQSWLRGNIGVHKLQVDAVGSMDSPIGHSI